MCDHFDPITTACAPSCCVCSYHGRCEKEKAVASAANTDNGKAGYGKVAHFPASHNNRNIRRIQA